MKPQSIQHGHFCYTCRNSVELNDKVFFLEEQSGAYFCSKTCIQEYYGPVSNYYHQQQMELRKAHDIPEEDFPQYEKYSDSCTGSPQEIWRDLGEHGEEYFYFIGNFSDTSGTFHYIVMCFCMEGEPTYIFLSFPTRDPDLVDVFRRGEKVDPMERGMPPSEGDTPFHVALTVDERTKELEEEMLSYRKSSDIPLKEFEEHSSLLSETLENPEEAWELEQGNGDKMLTLISQHGKKLHYIVLCIPEESDEDGDDEKENVSGWRVLYHFPTNSAELVKKYRRGNVCESLGTLQLVH